MRVDNKYKTYRDLPDFLKTEEGENILINGYIAEAMSDREIKVRKDIAFIVLTKNINIAVRLSSREIVLEILRDYVKALDRKGE